MQTATKPRNLVSHSTTDGKFYQIKPSYDSLLPNFGHAQKRVDKVFHFVAHQYWADRGLASHTPFASMADLKAAVTKFLTQLPA
jgi:hypothetical protein